ncbi:hypothetical protein M8C13_12230 [Crossiella sp. SN42]|uniref:hypothetical protein n=1 Tax=Crossiella sp. SN42 TaxID=2944808 RepID=UPI00207CECF5|nr:hypothetical protein [Crossiella sp. SN42]MCO1576518.1 hypothetical protein [Crossiella sp. SN42]
MPADEFPAPVRLLRPADLLDLSFTFHGLKFEDAFRRRLVPSVAGQDGLIVVALPPQHLLEEAFPEPVGNPSAPPVAARIAGGGQLVFTVGAGERVPYEEAGLLAALRTLPMRVVPVADGPGVPENPLRDRVNNPRTAIELPYRLYLSPRSADRWIHRAEAPPESGRVELWHTRLRGRTARAVWTRDFTGDTAPPVGSPVPPGPFLASLKPEHRRDIVHLTASHGLSTETGQPYLPQPVQLAHLVLSALGGYLDSHGDWSLHRPAGIDLVEWRHRAALGRDHYVRVVEAGFLAPFGHRAVKVTITERKFHPDRPGNPAYLRQRVFVVVREPVREFDPAEELTAAGTEHRFNHLFPFRGVRLLTLVTPDLVGDTEEEFFPATQAEKPFQFKAVGQDRNRRAVEFRTPLLFVPAQHNAERLAQVLATYQNAPANRVVSLGGQALAYADSARVDDTSLDTTELTWELRAPRQWAELPPSEFARFAPIVAGAKAVVAAASRLTGNAEAVPIGYAEQYAVAGFPRAADRADSPNKGEVFVEVKANVSLNFEANGGRDRSGGLAAPSIQVAGMSRITGPVGGTLANAAAGTFDPADVLDALKAKLFGLVPLSAIVRGAGLDEPLRAPRFLTETVNAVTSFLSDLHRIRELMDLVEQRFNQIAQRAREVRRTAAEFVDITGEFLAPGGAEPAIGDVEAKFNAFLNAVQALIAELPAGIDPAVPAFLERVRAQAATWTSAAGSAFSLKDSILKAAKNFTLPETVNTRLEWEPKVQNYKNLLVFRERGRFAVVVDLRGSLRPDLAVGADVSCSLEDFQINVLGVIELYFERIRFLARAGKKPDVEVAFGDVTFVGDLSFVQTLRNIIPFDGFSDPPSLDVGAEGITARYGMPLPSLAIGVFSLENIRLDAHFRLPFVGSGMEVGFSFCRREAPFRLTVAFFGGGGFFGIALNPEGLLYCEGALEFGAAVSMNLGVASGSLSVMAGIYFRIDGQGVELAGYFRARGEVDVLGLISASIELYLELRYDHGVVTGRATITITIEIAFFSESVEISCEKTFAGSPNTDARAALDAPRTLTFAEFMAPYTEAGLRRDPVLEYCSAFAEGA